MTRGHGPTGAGIIVGHGGGIIGSCGTESNPTGAQVSDNLELVKALGSKFIVRRDVKAVQLEENPVDHEVKAWQPVRSKFTLQDFEDHLAGRRTFGHYMVSQEGTCKLFAYDLDVEKVGAFKDENDEVKEIKPREIFPSQPDHPAYTDLVVALRCMAEGLAHAVSRLMELPVAIATSGGKGLHVYAFFPEETPATYAREAAIGVLNNFGCFTAVKGDSFFKHHGNDEKSWIYNNVNVEVFPKQESVQSGGYGNLMKLPLGVHRRTGMKSEFITTKAPLDHLVAMDSLRALQGDLPWE